MGLRDKNRFLGAAVLAAAILVLGGCGQMRPVGSRGYVIQHTVEPGETLYSIAWDYGYDYRQVAAWNYIDPPYRIYIGQRLTIIPPPGFEPPPPNRAGNSNPPRRTNALSPVETPATRPKVGDITWRWPAKGRVVQPFSAGKGKKGVDIEGASGQPIFAAAGGDVVYSGNGLIGYGNLVIIKHDRYYLSAYAHNRKLLVKEGDRVNAGQQIAEMGQTGKERSILHFEIRHNGKPIDPMKYLPEERL